MSIFSSALRRCLAGIALVACSAALLTPATAQSRNDFVSVKNNTVNVREKPSTRSSTLWELSRGYPLQVVQRQGQWLKVRDNEATLGWVHAPLTSKTPYRVITSKTVNLRASASDKSKRLRTLQQHEVVRSLKTSGQWVQVRHESGQTGWVIQRATWGW